MIINSGVVPSSVRFFQAENSLPGFLGASLWVQLSKIKAQAAARVGRSGILDGCFTVPEGSVDNIPQLSECPTALRMLSCPDLPRPKMKF